MGIDNNKKYPMRILSVNDSTIKAGLSGGIRGNYTVVVEIMGRGFAKYQNVSQIKFEYVNKVFKILPVTGSYFGGRLINISGSSFSADVLENEVHIGEQLCSVTSAVDNLVQCVTPAINEALNGQYFSVNVLSRQISNSTCVGTCSFTYLPITQSPYILNISHYKISNSNLSITIKGINLQNLNYPTKVAVINRISKKRFNFIPTFFNAT